MKIKVKYAQGDFNTTNLGIYSRCLAASSIFDIFNGLWDILKRTENPVFPKIEPKHAFCKFLNKPLS